VRKIVVFQFYRSFPKLPEATDDDIALLVDKYRDPNRAELVNYLNLANDIDAIGSVMDAENKLSLHNIQDVNGYIPKMVGFACFLVSSCHVCSYLIWMLLKLKIDV
jgi:hypothetical protein